MTLGVHSFYINYIIFKFTMTENTSIQKLSDRLEGSMGVKDLRKKLFYPDKYFYSGINDYESFQFWNKIGEFYKSPRSFVFCNGRDNKNKKKPSDFEFWLERILDKLVEDNLIYDDIKKGCFTINGTSLGFTCNKCDGEVYDKNYWFKTFKDAQNCVVNICQKYDGRLEDYYISQVKFLHENYK